MMTSQITSTNGSATAGQIKQFSRFVEDAAMSAVDTIGIDKGSMQNVIEHGGELQQGIIQVIQKLSVIQPEPIDRYGYIEGRNPRLEDLKRQMDIIHAQPEYAHLDLNAPWKFAKELLKSTDIPLSRQKLQVSIDPLSCFPDYNKALEASIKILSRRRKGLFRSDIKKGNFGPECLRQVAKVANPMESKLREEQGSGIWVELFSTSSGTSGKVHIPILSEFLMQEDAHFLALDLNLEKRKDDGYAMENYALARSAFTVATWFLTCDLNSRVRDQFCLILECKGDEISPEVNGNYSKTPFFHISLTWDYSIAVGVHNMAFTFGYDDSSIVEPIKNRNNYAG